MINYLALAIYLLISAPAHASVKNKCADLFTEKTYSRLFKSHYGEETPIQFEVAPAKQKSEKNKALLSKLRKLGAEGYHAQVAFRREDKYDSLEAAKIDLIEYNVNKSTERQYNFESFNGGVLTTTMRQKGIVLETLPSHFSSEIKARHTELKENGVAVVIGYGLEIPFGAGAVAKTSNKFNADRARGIIYVHPELFGQLSLNHEIQHIFDMVLRVDSFLEELPALTGSIASTVNKTINNEPLNWIELMRSKSLLKFPGVSAEAKASKQSVVNFFQIKGLKEMVLLKGRFRELFMAWTEVVNYSMRNAQLTYHQLWIDPLNPRTIIFAFKSGVSGYIIVKVTDLALQGIIYSVAYASSLTGFM